MSGIFKSSCRVWFETYHAAPDIIRSVSDWNVRFKGKQLHWTASKSLSVCLPTVSQPWLEYCRNSEHKIHSVPLLPVMKLSIYRRQGEIEETATELRNMSSTGMLSWLQHRWALRHDITKCHLLLTNRNQFLFIFGSYHDY
jgi:hypothetical protein